MKETNRKLGRIYVTGADGFIGSHLVDRLVKEGHEVTALCLYNSFGSVGWLEETVAKSPKNLKTIHGDIRDPFFLETTTAKHDTIFHLAALIAIPYSYVAPQSYFETNTLGTLNVCQAALRNQISRVIHTSTSEVYGTAQSVPISETHPLQGQSPYSASKIGADMVVESYFRSFGLPAITLRPFNTYGPRQSLRAVIPTVTQQILAGQKVIKLGNVKPTRDFNYVADTVDAFVRVGETAPESSLGETFNAGSGREISVENVVSLIAKLLQADVQISQDDARVRPEKSEVERLLADFSKLKAVTGYEPKTSLESGLEILIHWVKERGHSKDASRYHV